MMELRYALQLTRRWWWLVALCAVAGGLAAYAMVRQQVPEYWATATLMVSQVQTQGTVTYNDVLASERLTETYRRLIESLPVLEEAQGTLQLPGGTGELARLLEAGSVPQTQLIQVSARTQDPEQAANIANTVADVVIARNRSGLLGTRGSLSIAERAVTPAAPSGGAGTAGILLGLFGGAFVAVGLALLLEYADDRVRDAERVRTLGLSLLGTVRRRKGSDRTLVSRDAPDSADAEAYRVIRTAVQFAFLDRPLRSLFVTSAQPGEGKTTTAANLAIVAAQSGKRVVVVDADLRRPQIHRVFDLSNSRGLTDLVLQSNGHFGEFLQNTGVRNCWALTSGPLPPNPDSVMASTRLQQVLEQISTSVDLLIIDGPPVLPVADAGYLAHAADGTILVIDAGRTRRPTVARALASLQHAGATVIGSVLNRARIGQGDTYYGYGYRSVRHGADDHAAALAQARGKAPGAASRLDTAAR